MKEERFDGETFDQELDGSRLTSQVAKVKDFMMDGQWHTLPEIEANTKFPQASISARLRDLRKFRFGGYIIDRKRVSKGLFAYKLIVPSVEPEIPSAKVNSAVVGTISDQVQQIDRKPSPKNDLESLFWKQ